MSLLESIRSRSLAISERTIGWRRHLHAHPELSYQEVETSRYVAAALQAGGITTIREVAGTGLVVTIEGKDPQSRTIALRADMDALPIQEQNSVEYASTRPGVMHACGHDVHTSSLLGTAWILNELRNEWKGTVRLLFQPGEEKNPGGASLMIRDGALASPQPSGIIGQHVMPLLPVGQIGFREGRYMASSDEIYLRVIGKGGHGAAPDLAVDPVVISSHIIIGLQQVISRNANPKQPTVLTFGKVVAEGATNVIPDEVQIAGTFRALDEVWREEGLQRIKRMAEQMAESMGGRCEVHFSRGYPCLENDPALTRRIKEYASDYVGQQNVVDIDLTLGSEDFAYYSHVIPASFYRLGTRNESRGIVSYVHTPTFDIDEKALGISTGLMAWMAVRELAQP